ncbi:heterokaryon incompatibility protein het-6, partial [Fusarium sporotrichioides]
MHSWHSSNCGRPDVVIYEGLGVPVCMDCGEMAQSLDVRKDHQDELDIPDSPNRSEMRLTWPPSVPYSDDAYRYDKDGSLQKALEQHLEQLYCQNASDATTHSPLSEPNDLPWDQTSSGIKPVYKPLMGTKIRVLKLSRGRFESPLHGTLETIELDSEQPKAEELSTLLLDDNQNRTLYEAISYTWATISGNRQKNHVIFIGKSWGMLPITENCFDALRSCRLEDEDRYLWVDSICINQSDVSERTHQVGLMRQIYSAANRVLIYLSVDHAGSDSAAVKDDPEILCLNPYFSRIWVVQEIGSAKKAIVLYRQQSMGWDFFHTNLQRLMTRKWVRHFGRPRQIDDAESFLALLEDTWDCHASDPRDKVFALLGLWKASVEPDYNLSPQAVYIGLASTFVTNTDAKLAGRVLDMASQGHSMTGLPSWVPDWSVKSQQLYRRVWIKTSFVPSTTVSSGRSKRHKFRVHSNTGSLCAVAIEIDMLAPYLQKGFRVTSDGMATATVGQIQVSLPLHVTSKCEPTDRIFEAYEYEFFLILRRKTDTHIYTFVGLCDYQILATPKTTRVDAIRYLSDWAWLLDGRRTWKWSKLANWEKTHRCWLNLKEQQSLERRICLRRVFHKVYFLKKVHWLVEAARHILRDQDGEGTRLPAFFRRRWRTVCQQWRIADNRQVSFQREQRTKIQHLLQGYKSLEPSPESLAATQLEPSMWLPISSHWFQWIEHYGKDQLHSYYPPLAACIERQIPIPTLNLVDTPDNRVSLFLDADLETGLRQLQRVAHDYPLNTPDIMQKGRSYSLNTPHGYNFRTDYLDAFLRWLSKPWSPSVSLLKSKSNLEGLLIWEATFEDRYQIDAAHRRLDENFDKHLSRLSTSCGGEILFTEFFNFIYREQFELMWMFAFHNSDSTNKAVDKFPLFDIGVEFTRVFWWRFHRSIGKVFQIFGESFPTDDEIEQKWDGCLEWLSHGNRPSRVAELPMPELVFKRRPVYGDENTYSQRLWDFSSKLNRHGAFISIRLSGSSEDTEGDPHPRPVTAFAEERLSEIVHSEIQRRRLPEKVFAFLFNGTHTYQESPELGYTIFEAMVADKQLSVSDSNIIGRWRQEE